jgi:hypothetical protein
MSKLIVNRIKIVVNWRYARQQKHDKLVEIENTHADLTGKTKAGGFTCRAFADKAGFRANKGN